MRILSLNVNDFGGTVTKKEYTSNGMTKEWYKLDRTNEASKIFKYIEGKDPCIVILQEFELDTSISKTFCNWMETYGYDIVPHEVPKYKRMSITSIFIKKGIVFDAIGSPNKERSLRTSAVRVGETIICGTHIPPKPFDELFWKEIYDFYEKYHSEEVALVGDFNTINYENKVKFLELLDIYSNAVDAWSESGHPDDTPTICEKGQRLDRAIMSRPMYEHLKNIQIDPDLMDSHITDHAALIIDIDQTI